MHERLSVFFFKQKTADEMRISDWSSDGCSSDLRRHERRRTAAEEDRRQWPPIGQPRLMRHVREQRVPPLLLVHSLAHMAVEIAIRTFGNAKRPIDRKSVV